MSGPYRKLIEMLGAHRWHRRKALTHHGFAPHYVLLGHVSYKRDRFYTQLESGEPAEGCSPRRCTSDSYLLVRASEGEIE